MSIEEIKDRHTRAKGHVCNGYAQLAVEKEFLNHAWEDIEYLLKYIDVKGIKHYYSLVEKLHRAREAFAKGCTIVELMGILDGEQNGN